MNVRVVSTPQTTQRVAPMLPLSECASCQPKPFMGIGATGDDAALTLAKLGLFLLGGFILFEVALSRRGGGGTKGLSADKGTHCAKLKREWDLARELRDSARTRGVGNDRARRSYEREMQKIAREARQYHCIWPDRTFGA